MRLTWDDVGARRFRAGIDRGVLYPLYDDGYAEGIAWNGLIGIDDGTSGHDKTLLYNADRRAVVLFNPYEHGGTIRCYTYPDAFEECIGNEEIVPGLYATAQEQVPFGLTYRVLIGNDTQGLAHAYELHFIYGAYVSNASTAVSTVGGDSLAQEMSFGYESIVEEAINNAPTAHLVLSSRFASSEGLATIEDTLYGDADNPPRLLLPDELYGIMYKTQPIPDEYKYYPHNFRHPQDAVYPLSK